ncbi:MAG: hypothetical protein GY822_31550 [Deltaproteobacteria bacterium]|nr:hypothetical protein [Deltaproteobacteria bacterium]
MVPVARIHIESSSVYRFESSNGPLYLRAENGACFSDAAELDKGTYELYLRRNQSDQTALDFAFTDEERAFVFAEAPHIKSGALKTPLPFQVVIKRQEYRVRSMCGTGSQAPSFYLDVNKPLDKMYLSQLVSNGVLDVTVAGPLGSQKRPYEWCKSGKGAWLKKKKKSNIKGTYAIWVSGSSELVGQNAHLSASSRRDDRLKNLKAQGMPLTVLHPIAKMLPLPERQIWWHYPYYNRKTDAVEALFLAAPAQLFVFLTDDKDEIKATEPLLLQAYGTKKSVILRANGERHTIRTERLTKEAPKKGSAPQWADLKMPQKVATAQSLALPTDAVSFAKWYDLNDRKEDCIYRYMQKNDPSWGKDYDVINSRTGENVSDVHFRRADKSAMPRALKKRRIEPLKLPTKTD